MINIGIIVGSGLEDLSFLSDKIKTEFSPYYDKHLIDVEITIAEVENIKLFIIPRHGYKHELYPHNVLFQLLMKIFKGYKCKYVIGFTACGSLREEYKPETLYPIDQFIDLTSGRKLEYPEKVTHMPMGEPFDKDLTQMISNILNVSPKTMITINGPRFSTRAESIYFSKIGGDLINMTTATECIAANIENIPYATVAFVTDYDAWNDKIPHVTMEQISARFEEYKKQLKEFIPKLLKNISNYERSEI